MSRTHEMRIRTTGEYAWRKDIIEGNAEVWGCNNTRGVILACEFTQDMRDALEEALEHPHMTEELAEVLSTQHVPVEYVSEGEVRFEG